MNQVDILRNLVKFNTIKDKENESIINYIKVLLEEIGFKVEAHKKYLIMEYGKNAKLGFIGHSDTVDYIDGWNNSPFELTQIENKLYGLGSCDMKSGIAAFIQVLREIKLEELRYGIKVYITYDEEIGFTGIEEINKDGYKVPEYVIVGEPTDNINITGCKGLLGVKINTSGTKMHSSRTDLGKSANSNMIKILYELENFYNQNIKIELDERFEVPFTTMNVGLINGGSGINSISDNCDVYVDFRINKQEHIDIIKNKIKELTEKYDGTYIVDVDIKPFFNDIEFVKEKNTANFMTEASFVEAKRMILGAGPVTAHQTNEYITTESLEKLVKQYKSIIEEVCM